MSRDEVRLQIKETPISRLIGHYIPLQTRGTSVMGLCPFHSDSKPSMSVSDKLGLFRCFACDTGGDHITFVEKLKNIPFREALIECAGVLNIDISSLEQKKNQNPNVVTAQKILTSATKLYRKLALTAQFESFQSFLKDRDIPEDVAANFKLGICPEGSHLYNYLQSIPESDRGRAFHIAEQIAVISPSSYGDKSHYDTFNKRIIFPICDLRGQTVGFGSRATVEGQKGKYINSKDSFIFHKKDILYGLHLAKQSIREKGQVILVEGYMDAISMHRHGFTETVAIMGTALGERAIKNLKSFVGTGQFVLALDSDDAGRKASSRILVELLKQGISPKFLEFSPQKDPDEYLAAEGALGLKEKLENAPVLLEMEISELISTGKDANLDTKLAFLEDIFGLISPLGDELYASEIAVKYSKILGLSSQPSQIIDSYKEFLEKNKKWSSKPQVKTKIESEPPLPNREFEPINLEPSAMQNSPMEISTQMSKANKVVLQQIVGHPEILEHPKSAEILDNLANDEIKRVFHLMKEMIWEVDEKELPRLLIDAVSSEEYSLELREIISTTIFRQETKKLDSRQCERVLSDLNNRLAEEKLRAEKAEILKRQKSVVTDDDQDQLLRDITSIEKELNKIKKAKKIQFGLLEK
ncbi:MAG: DNA primase [Bacteriovoracaceae bacterium]|jgi:DNA primase|nr:DNA primase [Bacteriovoracaceae bacterium]